MRRECQKGIVHQTNATGLDFRPHHSPCRDTLFALLVLVSATVANASVVPFTEEFSDGPSGWFDAGGSAPLSWEASGGPDGSSFSFTDFSFAANAVGDSPVLFRAQDEFGSSGGAFEGDWIGDGVAEFSAMVRHDAGIPLSFFTRFASPFNFPGAIAIEFAPVPTDTWTRISFIIDPHSPQFVSFEGSDFESVFGNIGHLQIGVSVPEGLAGVNQQFAFGIDNPTIVPEPATVVFLLCGSLGCAYRRKRTLLRGKNNV